MPLKKERKDIVKEGLGGEDGGVLRMSLEGGDDRGTAEVDRETASFGPTFMHLGPLERLNRCAATDPWPLHLVSRRVGSVKEEAGNVCQPSGKTN